MSCRIFDEDMLRPCGKRCKDFKQLLLQISNSNEQELLTQILQQLYFGKVGEPKQKKGVIITQTVDLLDIKSDEPILLYVLLEGCHNLEFMQLLQPIKNFAPSFRYNSALFGRIAINIQPYNKCLCDECIFGQLLRSWISNKKYFYRVFVYKDFYISLYQYAVRYRQGISLIQQATEAASPHFQCCQTNYSRQHAVWLGDGSCPRSSICALAPKKNPFPSFVTRSWNTLSTVEPWLLKSITRNYLEVYSVNGYILHITNYPKDIERYVTDDNDDLFFIYNTGRDHFLITEKTKW